MTVNLTVARIRFLLIRFQRCIRSPVCCFSGYAWRARGRALVSRPTQANLYLYNMLTRSSARAARRAQLDITARLPADLLECIAGHGDDQGWKHCSLRSQPRRNNAERAPYPWLLCQR